MRRAFLFDADGTGCDQIFEALAEATLGLIEIKLIALQLHAFHRLRVVVDVNIPDEAGDAVQGVRINPADRLALVVDLIVVGTQRAEGVGQL